MPRNGSGAYSLPEAAFVPNTPISSAAVNSDFSDIATALTGSLARNGEGGMLAILPLANAGFTYLADPNTGMGRTAADTQVIICGGANVITATPTGVDILGNLTVSGSFMVGGAVLIPPGLIFPYAAGTAPSGYLICDGAAYSRSTYAALFAVIGTVYGAGNGTTTFNVPDLRGRVPAQIDGGTNRLPAIANLGDHAGSATNTILQENLPAATLATTIVEPSAGTGHLHNLTGLGTVSVTNGTGASQGNLLTTSGGSPATLTTQKQVSGVTASTALGGSGTALDNTQPTLGVAYLIKT